MKIIKQLKNKVFYGTALLALTLNGAYADTISGKYPWDKFMSDLSSDLTSNFAVFAGIIGLVICGGFVIFGDLQGGARKAFNVGLGLSIILNVSTIMMALFSQGTLLF